MIHRFRAGLGTILLIAATACHDPAAIAVNPSVTGNVPGRIRVALGTSPARWVADHLVIDSARIASDTLHVHVKHGGGCALHEYAAVAWNGWLESNPVQVGVLLAHESNDDMCDALLVAHLRFDLAPLRDAYRQAYGSSAATLVLNLTEASALARTPSRIEYRF